MMTRQVRVVYNAKDTLGEGPLWSTMRNGIYWVDILGKRLQFFSGRDGYQFWPMPKMPSALAECSDGTLVVALQDEVVKFDTASGAISHIADLDTDRPGNRSNDGKCDHIGNFWVGTMQHEPTEIRGRLWCIAPTGDKTEVLDGIGIANTLAWDTARGRFYFADSMAGEIYRFRSLAGTAIKQRAVFASNNGDAWAPDGSTIDAEGYLWNAQWDASRIVRYAPDGSIDQMITLPVRRPTSCTFGGPDLTTLFITSAQSDDPAEALGGALLAIETPYRGLAANLFAG